MPRFERRGGFRSGGRFGSRFDRGFDRESNVPKPVKVGEEYDVEISEVGSRGDGIARVNNFVVFVNGAKQGEKTKIKIKEVRNRFAIGEKVGEAGAAEVAEEASEAVEETEEVTEETTEEATKEPEEVTEETTEEE
jgi:predicted RNA-binding protein with TRAM domain